MKQFCSIELRQLLYQRAFKKLIKIGEFLGNHGNTEDGRKHISDILCFIISKKLKNTTEMQKKICAVYGEGAVIERIKSGW